MALNKEDKKGIIKSYSREKGDTGSPEVQIALLTARIKQLQDHFRKHPKDFHSKRGFIKIVQRRKKLLNYLKETAPKRYTKIIKELGLRK